MRRRMRGSTAKFRFAWTIGLGWGALSIAQVVWAGNHVRVESIASVAPGTTNLTIGVYISNDVSIQALVLPLEIRTCNGAAYIAGPEFTRGLNPVGRVYNSPLGPQDPAGRWPDANMTNRTFSVPNPADEWACHRFSDPSTRWAVSSSVPDFVSPDAVFLATISTGDPTIGEIYVLGPGADPPGVPSYRIICNVGAAIGVFVVDTTCISPANHLVFVDDSWLPIVLYPTFEAGRIGVGGGIGECAPVECSCPCHADPIDCGGIPLGILDVVSTIDVAFRAVPATRSPNCPYENTDLDCSSVTDIVDVVRIIDVELRGVPLALRVCAPCGAGN